MSITDKLIISNKKIKELEEENQKLRELVKEAYIEGHSENYRCDPVGDWKDSHTKEELEEIIRKN